MRPDRVLEVLAGTPARPDGRAPDPLPGSAPSLRAGEECGLALRRAPRLAPVDLMRRLLLPVWLGVLLPQAALADATATVRYGSVADADLGAARMQAREYGLGLQWSDGRFAAGAVRVGLDYAYTRYQYERLPTRNRDLHRVRVPVEWKGGAVRRQSVMLAPVIAASSNVFKDLPSRGSSEDYSLHGHWHVERPARGEGWGWRVGVARSDVFGGLAFHPVIAALWRGARAMAEVGWPGSRIEWRVRPAVALGAELLPAGGRWHVVSDERDGADFYYNMEAWRGGLTAAWAPRRRLQLAARAGVEFARRHRFEDDTGAIVDRDPDAAPYVELALGWRW